MVLKKGATLEFNSREGTRAERKRQDEMLREREKRKRAITRWKSSVRKEMQQLPDEAQLAGAELMHIIIFKVSNFSNLWENIN